MPKLKTRKGQAALKARVRKAIKLYRRFKMKDPKYIDEIDFEFHDVLMEIGKCDGVMYTTNRNDGNKNQSFIHEFTGQSCPKLCASYDGNQLYFIGGNYNFTDEGITDK